MSEAGDGWAADPAGHVVLRLARLLLAAGADTDHVYRRMAALAAAKRLPLQLFIGSERLLVMTEAGGAYRTRIGHSVGGMGINAGKLVDLEELARAIERGKLDPNEADRKLSQIESSSPRFSSWTVVVAVAATAASLARLFGADWPVVGGALVGGLASAMLRHWLAARGLSVARSALIAAVTACAGAVTALWFGREPPALAMVAAGMILVPGVPLLNGVADLVAGHAAIAVARLAGGVANVLAIGFGLIVASYLTGVAVPLAGAPGSVSAGEDFLFSGVAALGFAMLFDAPVRALPAIVGCGAASHACRTALEAHGVEPAAATFLCAVMAGLLACAFGKRIGIPWPVLAYPSVVAMIPGSFAFRAAIGALSVMDAGATASPALMAETLSTAIAALVTTVAIALGVVSAAAIARSATGGQG